MRQRRTRRRGGGYCQPGSATEAVARTSKSDLPESVIAAMDEALADERNALASYQAVMKRFGPVRRFVNIAEAEQRHINALLELYVSYGIHPSDEVAEVDAAIESNDLKTLCEMGVQGEIENVRLFDEELLPAVSDYPDILAVMTNLRNASALRHKRAFERCVNRYSAK